MKLVPSFSMLACDYDGTLATDGRVDATTFRALERVRGSGRKVVLITGRQVDDLQSVCARLGIFDVVIAENGAVLFWPQTQASEMLAAPPPAAFADELRRRGVTPLEEGRVVVATRREQLRTVRAVVRQMDLDLDLILNKDSLMVLPSGVDKASGLRYLLEQCGIAADEVVGVGDAENDEPLLRVCGFGVAVANALPSVRRIADFVTTGSHGAGVVELVDMLLAVDQPLGRSVDESVSRRVGPADCIE